MLSQDRFVIDRTGFPMIWCKEVETYVHFLPITKIQFEYFLCDVPDAYFDADWYDRILNLNPRVTPSEVSAANYWRALMTGVKPAESQRFAAWCGPGFRLPTDADWTAIYRSVETEPAEDLHASGLLEDRDQRVRALLERIDVAVVEASARMRRVPGLAGQMLLRFGAMEWVRVGSPPSAWGVRGEPLPDFCGNLERPEHAAASLVADPNRDRFPEAGFRLLYSPSAAAAAESGSAHPPSSEPMSDGG